MPTNKSCLRRLDSILNTREYYWTVGYSTPLPTDRFDSIELVRDSSAESPIAFAVSRTDCIELHFVSRDAVAPEGDDVRVVALRVRRHPTHSTLY